MTDAEINEIIKEWLVKYYDNKAWFRSGSKRAYLFNARRRKHVICSDGSIINATWAQVLRKHCEAHMLEEFEDCLDDHRYSFFQAYKSRRKKS